MKQARFIQIIEIQDTLYALDEEGRVWRYGDDGSTTEGHLWLPLSSKRYEAPAEEPDRTVGFRNTRPRKG